MRKLAVTELQRIDIDTFKQSQKIPLVMVLDNVRSLHNIGSIFRTADAFRVEHIYLCGMRWCSCNAAKVDVFYAESIGCSKNRAHVV